MKPFYLMVQGTTSDAGKSTIVAALCRLLKKRGVSVAPFKPQNMALNSAVTVDGGEIGRAQALQAQACGLPAHTDMNPVLIKPSSDIGAQIIIHGQVKQNMDAQAFHRYKPQAMGAVLESYRRLQAQYDSIIVEGAGSPAEINLRDRDIANMGFAEAADCPVIIVADIDKGGVFAHIVGTLALLSESEKQRVKGFIINKFRGDIALLESGLDWLEEKTGKPVFAVMPYLHDFYLDAEDAIDTLQRLDKGKKLRIVVPVFPRISNHTDMDVLRLHPQVDLSFVPVGAEIPACDLIILPGSKSVRDDLTTLKSNNWAARLNQHLRYGGKLLAICGGYQMLGEMIDDPEGIEGHEGSTEGFNFIPMHTVLHREKVVRQRSGYLCVGEARVPFAGYEIHNGRSLLKGESNSPLVDDKGIELESYLSDDEQIFGSYIHGILDNPEALQLILQWAGLPEAKEIDLDAMREQQLDRLAKVLEEHLDPAKMEQAFGSGAIKC